MHRYSVIMLTHIIHLYTSIYELDAYKVDEIYLKSLPESRLLFSKQTRNGVLPDAYSHF